MRRRRSWAVGVVLALVAVVATPIVIVDNLTGNSPNTSSALRSSARSGAAMGGMSPSGIAAETCHNLPGLTEMGDGMIMAPVSAGQATPAQRAAADKLVAATVDGLRQFQDQSVAIDDGYVRVADPGEEPVHYANWNTVLSNDVLDPAHPSALMYIDTVRGPVLVGAMYLGPGLCRPGPDIGGPLTPWHAHAYLCLDPKNRIVGSVNSSNKCSEGTHSSQTYFMLHVWTAPSIAATYQFVADVPTAAFDQVVGSGIP